MSDARFDLELIADVLAIAAKRPGLASMASAMAVAMVELAIHEPLQRTDPPLDGDTIMATLGLEPGPQVGRALAHLETCRIERGVMSRAEALDEIEAWATHAEGQE